MRLKDILKDLDESDGGVVLLLDQVTDPHNIGAILRSAAAFGALAVIVPEAGAPDETGVLAKSASGALEVVPLVRVTNLARAMDQLKELGFWCIGMDGHATNSIGDQKLPSRAAFVMGSEGDGMRRLTAENCDFVTKLPMSPAIESLNVSNAAAITLYEYRRQYPFETKKG
jgi:23S rRNA (guanosine2251-2'-O)-methyltransferase